MHAFFSLISIVVFLFPHSAQAFFGGTDLEDVIDTATELINKAIPILAGLALLFFFWGLALYILSVANEPKKEESKMIMVWGVVALFVMVSVWGLVNLISKTFGFDSVTTQPAPIIDPEELWLWFDI